MDIVRAFSCFVLVGVGVGVSACGGDDAEANLGDSQAMGAGFGGGSGGMVADASTGSTAGTAYGGGAGGSSSAADANGSGDAALADVTTAARDARAEVVTDVRVSVDGPTCIMDPGSCDCIAVCYVSSDCPAGRTCQCEMGPCFCHRCAP